MLHRRSFLSRVAAPAVAIAAVTLVTPLHGAGRVFAWKATGKPGVVYLVGSVHLLSNDFYPLNPALETAYKDSNLLAEEVNLGEMEQPDAQMTLAVDTRNLHFFDLHTYDSYYEYTAAMYPSFGFEWAGNIVCPNANDPESAERDAELKIRAYEAGAALAR